jgi:DNA-directed RNA polymerase subunit RPC12/RpoP
MSKCSWCGKRTTKDKDKRDGMCASCWKNYKRIGKNLDKYA